MVLVGVVIAEWLIIIIIMVEVGVVGVRARLTLPPPQPLMWKGEGERLGLFVVIDLLHERLLLPPPPPPHEDGIRSWCVFTNGLNREDLNYLKKN